MTSGLADDCTAAATFSEDCDSLTLAVFCNRRKSRELVLTRNE